MIKYRVAEENDLPEVCNVLRKSFPIYEQMGLNTDYLEKLSKIDTGVRDGDIYVAETSDNRIVSTLFIIRRELSIYPSFLPVAGVANVATIPSYRGKKIARTLLSYALNESLNKGYSTAALFVSYGVPAHRIYRRLKFHDMIVYHNRVCVLDDIVKAYRWLEENLSTKKVTGKIEIVKDPSSAGIEGNLKTLYYRFINKKYRGSVYRTSERWKGILSLNPFETWFVSDPRDKIITVTNGGIHGYVITYYIKSSILSKSHDLGLGIVTEIVSRDVPDAIALLQAVFRKAMEDGIGTLTFRPPPDLDEYLPICKTIGSPETFMAKVLNYEKLMSDIKRFLTTRPLDGTIRFCIKTDEECKKIILSNKSVEIINNSDPSSCDIIMSEGSFLRILFATRTTFDECYLGYLRIKTGNVKRKLEVLNNVLKGRRRHYLSLIDKW